MNKLENCEIKDDELERVVGGAWDNNTIDYQFRDGERVLVTGSGFGQIVGEGCANNYFGPTRQGQTVWYKVVLDTGEKVRVPQCRLQPEN